MKFLIQNSAMKTYSFLITMVNIVAMIIQLVKVFKKYKEKDGLKGLSYWAFCLVSVFVVISTLYLIKLRKKFYYLYYFVSVSFFILIAIMIMVYEKSDKSTNKEQELANRNIIIYVVLMVSVIIFGAVSYSKGSVKYWTILAFISGLGIGLCSIPYVMHVYKYGDSGISFLFLVLTLMADIVVFISAILTRTITIIVTMLIYFVTKTMVIIRMIQLSKENEDTNDDKKNELSSKTMINFVIIFSCIAVVLIVGLLLTRIYDKRRNISM